MTWNKDTRHPHPTEGATGADPANLEAFARKVDRAEGDRTAPGGHGKVSENAAEDASDPTGYGGAASPDVREAEARRAFGEDNISPAPGDPPATSS